MSDIVQEHLEKAVDYVAKESARRFHNFATLMLINSKRVQAVIGSPLEMLFLLWWSAVTNGFGKYDAFSLEPQAEVTVQGQRYRVDFLVVPSDLDPASAARWRPIAIEVDGHAFHERTREQVQVRDSRDRALMVAGWRVFHFSFAEFTADPVTCVQEVAEYAFLQSVGRNT